MTITINVQPNKDKKLLVSSRSYDGGDPFVTLEVAVLSEGSVTVFLRNVDDARLLMDASIEAYKNVVALETERVVAKAKADAEAVKVAPITESDPELERLLAEEEAIEARFYEPDWEGPCQCHLCVEQF